MLRFVSFLLLSSQVALAKLALLERSTIYENPYYTQGKFDTDDFSDTCLDKLCLMMESFTSCKAFPINWDKTCSKYLLGYAYSCPIFPPPENVFNAPSVCLTDLVAMTQNGPPDITELIGGSTAESCEHNCYQTYLDRSYDFFASCSGELGVNNTVLAGIKNFQVYRSQGCVQNNDGNNCFDMLKQLMPIDFSPTPAPTAAPAGTPTPAPPPNPLFDYTCPYPSTVYQNFCGAFASFKCCYGNEISMLEQTFNKLVAPCVQNNMKAICPTVDPEVYCTFGSKGSVGTSPALVRMNISRAEGLPNMYSENEVMNFRSITTQPLMLSPLTAMVTSFVYYNGDTPIVGSDITGATSADFNLLITQQWSSNATWANIVTQMGAPSYAS